MEVRTSRAVQLRILLAVTAGTLFAASCADAPETPTAPSARASSPSSRLQAPRGIDETVSPASSQAVLLLTKTCDAIDHCTVITSPSGPIPVGSDVNYLGPLLETRTTSKVLVTTPDGDTAVGHCSVSYRTGEGTCVLTGGTGALVGLHANLKVSSDFVSDPSGVFTWEGRFHFER